MYCCGCCWARRGLLLGWLLVLAGLTRLAAPLGQDVRADEPKSSGSAWPMFGGTPARNMVNLVDKNIVTEWKVEAGQQQNIKWVGQLGNRAWTAPVVADGKVFIGTNNAKPRDKKIKGPRAVLMCFEETTGKFLWQLVHEMPPEEIADMAIPDGLCSTPTVEGKRLWYITPACEVVCATTDGKVLWTYDMMKKMGVIPCFIAASSPLIVGDRLFVVTGNGVPVNGELQAKAPSFAAFDKNTGKPLWQSALPGDNIIEGQWSNPVHAKVNGKDQVIFPGGDAWLYGLDAADGKLIWKFHCNTQKEVAAARKKGDDGKKGFVNYIVATPVVYENRCYVGVGWYPDHPIKTSSGHFWCIDITRTGDLSPVNDNLDPKAPENQKSGLVWHLGGEVVPKALTDRKTRFGPTLSTAAIHDGLVYIAEHDGYLYCLDAATGQKYWEHDFKTSVIASPYYVDGKVYLGTEEGDIVIFAAGRQKKVINTVYMGEGVGSTPAVANGTLYIMTKSKVYAIGR